MLSIPSAFETAHNPSPWECHPGMLPQWMTPPTSITLPNITPQKHPSNYRSRQGNYRGQPPHVAFALWKHTQVSHKLVRRFISELHSTPNDSFGILPSSRSQESFGTHSLPPSLSRISKPTIPVNSAVT